MKKELSYRLLVLSVSLTLLLSACGSEGTTTDASSSNTNASTSTGTNTNTNSTNNNSNVLTWTRWNGFDNFLELAGETYPEIEWEYTAYAGANRTGYSWVQMQADDIPDIFISSQILDEDLAKKRLIDLTDYGFIDGFSTSLLDQMSIDGVFTRCLSTTLCTASITTRP